MQTFELLHFCCRVRKRAVQHWIYLLTVFLNLFSPEFTHCIPLSLISDLWAISRADEFRQGVARKRQVSTGFWNKSSQGVIRQVDITVIWAQMFWLQSNVSLLATPGERRAFVHEVALFKWLKELFITRIDAQSRARAQLAERQAPLVLLNHHNCVLQLWFFLVIRSRKPHHLVS
jgi:hypothetical protein